MTSEGVSLSASSFYSLYRPSTCEKRVFLSAQSLPEGKPSELELLMKELGERHEKEHLSTFPEVRNLADGSLADRAQRTKEAALSRAPVIYQGVLRSVLPGLQDLVTGIPDFMILRGNSYCIRDCKLSRSIRGDKHLEIVHQLHTYGWLFERTFGSAPAALEAYLGDRTIEAIAYEGPVQAERDLERIRTLALLTNEPWEPVGWSKCSPCPFQQRCWAQAASNHDVSMVPGVDQGTARVLRDLGITTYDELATKMDAGRLAQLNRPRGNTEQRVGAAAVGILIHARALATGKVIQLDRLDLPPAPMVMLDLEGMPPHHDELDTVYLWGTQVYGDDGPVGPYRAALASFGPGTDREGWTQFLDTAGDVLDGYGQIPFVHWGDYEKSKIKAYIDRFGDPDGVGACVLECCFDLLKAVRDSFALPVPSYGLKVIEHLAGYRRTMEEYGGDWAIGRCIRASESKDPAERSRIMGEIARYNGEDLQAMAAVFRWAKGLSGTV